MLARLANFASVNMFEILILLSLIGGISVYRNNWNSAADGKIGVGDFTLQNIGDVFKHLFLWLIIINVGLIALFLFILFKKWKLQFSSDETMSQDLSKQVQTKRTSLGSTRKSGSAPVSASKMKQLKQNLKNYDVKKELNEEDETKQDELKDENQDENQNENPDENPDETQDNLENNSENAPTNEVEQDQNVNQNTENPIQNVQEENNTLQQETPKENKEQGDN